jgi:hypothetical protein
VEGSRVTGVPGTVGRPVSGGRPDWTLPRAPGRLKPARTSRFADAAVPEFLLRAGPFLLLAFFAAAHWVALVEPAQTRRALVVSLIATAAGMLIALSARLPRPAGIAVRLVLIVLTTLLAVTAAGIRFKLLMPAGWGTLGDRVTGGLSVVGSVSEWPYAGPNVWLRLTTLLAVPLVLVLASVLAFWPRAKQSTRPLALILLVSLYAVAVASRPFGAQGLRGVGLLVCLAAWLWLPRLRGRDAGAAITAIVVAGLVALILTPKLASGEPWVDYRHWSWSLHRERTISFNWRPAYGPLHWPRKGTTLLLVKSKSPQYWKAQTLDRFDGYGWTTTPNGQPDPTFVNRVVSHNPKWVATAHVTVRGVRSQLVAGPGSIQHVSGLSQQLVSLSNGTYVTDGEIGSGDSYTVQGYAPDPSVKQMRSAPSANPLMAAYTAISLPQQGGFVTTLLHVPLRGAPSSGEADAAAQLGGSRYARIYRLAKKITAGATTSYDMVRRVGSYLESNYRYSEGVPRRKYPIEAFLFQDKRGYCQHFSGAAALMLRMLGIPTRVATGFAPGTFNGETREYVVRDFDAHSWIEVWFEGIGWVPFDPTPAAAPATSQAASFQPFSEIASAARGDAKDRLPKKKLDALLGVQPKAGGASAAQQQNGTPWGWIALAVVAAALTVAAVVVSLMRRRRRRPLPPPCGDPEVDHLVRLLARLGLVVEPGTTLLELEQRIRRLGGADAAGYAERLRRRRFGGATEAAPDRAERRKLRQALAAAVDAGLLARVHLAMPHNQVMRPGGLKARRPRRSP